MNEEKKTEIQTVDFIHEIGKRYVSQFPNCKYSRKSSALNYLFGHYLKNHKEHYYMVYCSKSLLLCEQQGLSDALCCPLTRSLH
ncbi:MAG: hypothetical protein EOM50_23995 [Erysipelotrichia bacterium]|nr:hypothetical protein [Erysipelotrichia bacterium]